MPSGKVWAGILPAGADQDTGATPAGMVRTVSINAVNTGAAAATLKAYVGLNAVSAAGDRIDRDIAIPANSVFKLTGEIVGAGERIILRTEAAGVVARVTCFEEPA